MFFPDMSFFTGPAIFHRNAKRIDLWLPKVPGTRKELLGIHGPLRSFQEPLGPIKGFLGIHGPLRALIGIHGPLRGP